MDEYFIGAGALLTAGRDASIAGATIHAQTERHLASEIRAAVFDFEAARGAEVSRLLIAAGGWGAGEFRSKVVLPLLAMRECELADVIGTLASAVATGEVHLFARWTPDPATAAALASRGIRLVCHPLEAIGQAALVSGQRLERWHAPFRAA